MKKIKNNKQKREDDSKQVEKSSCQKFLEFYNKQLGKNIKFVRFGNPDLGKGEPDCICSDGLNIEVATAFYDNLHAKSSWGFIELLKKRISIDGYEKKYSDNTRYIKNPSYGLYNSINKRIIEKNKKEYNYDGKLFLLIFSRPDIIGERAIEAYIKQYRDFENIFFDEIWLLIYSEGYYKIYQLAKLGDKFLSKTNNKIKFERIKKMSN